MRIVAAPAAAAPRGPLAMAAADAAVRWRANPTALRVALAAYICVAITKIHEAIPVLGVFRPAMLVALVLIPTAAATLPVRELRAVLGARATRFVLVIAALAVVSFPFGVWPGNSFGFLSNQFWKTLVFFVIAATAMTDRRTMAIALGAFTLCTGVVAAQMVAGAAPSEAGRLYTGTAFDPNESALLFLVTIPFALQMVSRGGGWVWLGYGTAGALVGAIVKTGSRGGFLGLMVLGGWLILRAKGRTRGLYLLGVLAGLGVFMATADAETRARFSSIFAPEEDYNVTTREGRVQVWKRGIGYMLDNPVLGVGVQNFPIADGVLGGKENEGYGIKYSAAHNSFVEIGAELGVIGLLSFVGMLATSLAACARLRRRGAQAMRARAPAAEAEMVLATAAESSLIAFVVAGSFLSFAYHPLTFFLVANALAVRIGSRVPMEEERRPPVLRPQRARPHPLPSQWPSPIP